MPHFDFIIVGHGLAGSVLALSLIKENKKVLIIDEHSLSSSSKVAAGLYQPMTFKRTVETWKGLESITHSSQFYQWAEEFLQSKFFYPIPMYRIFSSFEEQNNWALKSDDHYFSKLIGEEKNNDAENCNPKFGYGRVFHSGYLDIPVLLQTSSNYFSSINSLLHEKIDYSLIKLEDGIINFKNFSANRIVFCEGWLVKNNPWFSYIPMKPVKGEVLNVKLKSKNISSVISGGLFAVPRIEGDYKVGSNYNWSELDEIPTSKIKDDFIKEITEILNDEVIVTKHTAGVRPASQDRRPVIGNHPNFNNIFIFNGLGARGVALAPYTVKFLIDNLISKTEIPLEISVSRFNKHLPPFSS